MPKICVFYTNLSEVTERTVNQYIPEAEFVKTTGTYGYRDELKARWGSGQDLITIEQDIEVTADVLPSFRKRCRHHWCVFSYQGPPHLGYLYRSLGCTRFSAKLQRDHPFSEFVEYGMEWKWVDVRISRILWTVNGIQPHVHGHVNHHRDFADKFDPVKHVWPVCCQELQPDGRTFVYRNQYPSGERGEFIKDLGKSSWLR